MNVDGDVWDRIVESGEDATIPDADRFGSMPPLRREDVRAVLDELPPIPDFDEDHIVRGTD